MILALRPAIANGPLGFPTPGAPAAPVRPARPVVPTAPVAPVLVVPAPAPGAVAAATRGVLEGWFVGAGDVVGGWRRSPWTSRSSALTSRAPLPARSPCARDVVPPSCGAGSSWLR